MSTRRMLMGQVPEGNVEHTSNNTYTNGFW